MVSAEAYRQAGVDIDAGEALVDAIKPLARSTMRPGSNPVLGGFGAFLDLKQAGYKDPLIVLTTDGVGTKLKLAVAAKKHDTVGIDLVATCANDLIVQGAEPIAFLDYYASGKLDVAVGRTIVAGIAEGCRQAGFALVGGETAEMPGMYYDGDYDLAGFGVGAVERGQALLPDHVKAGDVVLGLASSGVHSNGYSLVRKLVAEAKCPLDKPAPYDATKFLGESLLTPTRIYAKPLLSALKLGGIKSMAHISGGGLIDNIPRALPVGLGVHLDARRWPLLPVFQWLSRQGKLDAGQMARTFNCGIGMAVIVDPAQADSIQKHLTAAGEAVFAIGQTVPTTGGSRVHIEGTDTAWPRV